MDNFPVKLPLRLDWSEMDLFGHINNVKYFEYIQASRVNYWELTGLSADFKRTRIGPILLSTSCHFIKPLFYPGNITVAARIEFIKNTSFGIHHQVWNDQQKLCAEAHDIIVNFDFEKNEKIPISEAFRTAAGQMENKTF